MFALHPQLQADTFPVTDLQLCRVLLMNDCNYPWVILVPRKDNIREIHQLDGAERQTLMDEMSNVAQKLEHAFSAKKMNVAALGNMVPQLHVHVVARFEEDPAWPTPIWGKVPAKPYDEQSKALMLERVRSLLVPEADMPLQEAAQ
ncbi:MAG: HIT domain-containing protein [Proteobacteria bacterium]|nr:HIT domain-containing protein [Pseudomonadota bacterium]